MSKKKETSKTPERPHEAAWNALGSTQSERMADHETMETIRLLRGVIDALEAGHGTASGQLMRNSASIVGYLPTPGRHHLTIYIREPGT